MCALVEEYADKKAKEAERKKARKTAEETAENMLKSGEFQPEDIIKWVPVLSLEEVRELQKSIF